MPRQGLSVTSVQMFGSLDTTEPAIAALAVDMAEKMSMGDQSNDGPSTYAAPVRQGPGGNSSLVLG